MYKIKAIPTPVCICDRCGRVMRTDDHDEYQERLSIDFKAGYGSIFGDGNTVQTDLCQHCVRKVFGRWLRVSEQSHEEKPYRAYQPHQMLDRDDLATFRRAFTNEIRRNSAARRPDQDKDKSGESSHD